jgi:hypothetical protein
MIFHPSNSNDLSEIEKPGSLLFCEATGEHIFEDVTKNANGNKGYLG